VAGDLLFGVWYIRPNQSKTFPLFLPLPVAPSPSWPLARSASSISAQLPLNNDHLCLRRCLQNKRLSKGKKGVKKKVVDPFTRKGQQLPLNLFWNIRAEYHRGAAEWYDIKGPSFFEVKNVGKTLVNRSQGLSMCSKSSQSDCSVLTRNLQKMQTTRSRVGSSKSRLLTSLRTKIIASARSSCALMKCKGRTV